MLSAAPEGVSCRRASFRHLTPESLEGEPRILSSREVTFSFVVLAAEMFNRGTFQYAESTGDVLKYFFSCNGNKGKLPLLIFAAGTFKSGSCMFTESTYGQISFDSVILPF